jgi:hypothetical protein
MKEENTLQAQVQRQRKHTLKKTPAKIRKGATHLSGFCSSSEGEPLSTHAPSRTTTTWSQYRTLVMLFAKGKMSELRELRRPCVDGQGVEERC